MKTYNSIGGGASAASTKITAPDSPATDAAGATEGGKGGKGGDSPPSAAFTPTDPAGSSGAGLQPGAAKIARPGEGANQRGKGGKGGAPAAAISVTNAEFLAAVFFSVPENATPIVTAKNGDPSHGPWIAKPVSDVEQVCRSDLNTYVNCASVRQRDGEPVSAKKAHAAAFHALVLDDVGTKGKSLPDGIVPTWIIETSPDNFQVGFVLDVPETDQQLVEDAQHAVADAGFCDPGALGMVRWVRLPNGVNGKQNHRGTDGRPFTCRLTEWNPGSRHRLEDIVHKLAGDTPRPPSKARSPIRASSATSTAFQSIINPDVFIPAAQENPVVTALKAADLYKAESGPGQHSITCPWVEEHGGQLDSGAAYFEPSPLYPLGGFKCFHSHTDRYGLKEVLAHFELTRRDVGNKPCIRVIEGELQSMVDAAQVVLAETGRVFQFGGHIVRVVRDSVTGAARFVQQSDADLTLLLASVAEWERCDPKGEKPRWYRCNPAPNCVRLLAQSQGFDHLPEVVGIARQPILESNGKFLDQRGYDAKSKLYCEFDPTKFVRSEPTQANARLALARIRKLLEEFRFASEQDEAAALSAIFTGVMRSSIGRAPAFHVRAPSPGTGKSYLCDVIARFAGPGEPAKVSYPRTDEEATKVILAAMLHAPAVLDFDDMTVDWRPYGAVNRLLTASTMTDRILGSSKMATVSTDTLVLASGNNTGPIGDLMRRVLVIDLDACDESPATLRYRGNPLGQMAERREESVADVMLIIEAWLAAGSPAADISAIATYDDGWTKYCRQPLIWLGMPDPAFGLLTQLRDDPDVGALKDLLNAWYKQRGNKPVTVRAMLEDPDGDLIKAIEDLPFFGDGPINRSKFGHYLKRNVNRPVDGLRLEKAPCSERNAWRVVRFGTDAGPTEAPPLPPSPPSVDPHADEEITNRVR